MDSFSRPPPAIRLCPIPSYVRKTKTENRLIFNDFPDTSHVIFVEDRGDQLHGQHNALDSGFVFDLNVNYANPLTPAPVRILAGAA